MITLKEWQKFLLKLASEVNLNDLVGFQEEERAYTDNCGMQLSGVSVVPQVPRRKWTRMRRREVRRSQAINSLIGCAKEGDVYPGGQGKPMWLRKWVRILRTSDSGMIWKCPGYPWLGLPTSTAVGIDSISGQRTKILQVKWCRQEKVGKEKKRNDSAVIRIQSI